MKWQRHKSFFIFLLVISWFSFGLVQKAEAWWNSNYQYRMKITVTNNDSIQLPANTIVAFTADTESLIPGKLRDSESPSNDWRIVYDNGGTEDEIAQLVESGWDTDSTETWFRLQAAIDASANDDNYYVYYGYSGETTSPSTFTTTEETLSQQTTGLGAGAEALDFSANEYGGVQEVSINPGTSRYWKITKFTPYVHQICGYCGFPCSNNDIAAFIFTDTDQMEGDQIINGKSDVVDADTVSTGDNDLPWSGDKPHIKTGPKEIHPDAGSDGTTGMAPPADIRSGKMAPGTQTISAQIESGGTKCTGGRRPTTTSPPYWETKVL